MATYAPYPQPYPEPVSETSTTAIFALIIAVIALVVIIFVIYFFSANQVLVKDTIGQWNIIQGGKGATGTFTGSPNTIYSVPGDLPAAQALTVSPYTNIDSFVSAGSITTEFKIDNSVSKFAITVTPTPTTSAGPGTVGQVPAGAVHTYAWVSSTTFSLIGWSIK